jgi:hypothetical protein
MPPQSCVNGVWLYFLSPFCTRAVLKKGILPLRPLRYIAELLVLGLLANWVPAQGQTVPPETPTSSAQAPAERLQPETVEAYRSAIQAELETVVKSDLTKEELEKARAPYDDMLRLLAALDAAWQRQLRYTRMALT